MGDKCTSVTGAIFSKRPRALEACRVVELPAFEANALGAKGDGPGQGVDAGSKTCTATPMPGT